MHSVSTCSLMPETKILVTRHCIINTLKFLTQQLMKTLLMHQCIMSLLSFPGQMTLQHCWQERNIFKRCKYKQKAFESNLYALYKPQFHYLILIDIKGRRIQSNIIVPSCLSLSQFPINIFQYTVHVFLSPPPQPLNGMKAHHRVTSIPSIEFARTHSDT